MGVSLKIVFFSLLFCVLAGIVSTGREEPVSRCRRGPLRCEIPAADCVTCNCTNPFINTQCDWYCKAQEAINKNTALNWSLADLQDESRKISDKLEQSRIISDEILVQVMKNIKERIFNESIADLKDQLNRKAQESQRTERIFNESIADLKDQLKENSKKDNFNTASFGLVIVILIGMVVCYCISHRAEIKGAIWKCSGQSFYHLVPGIDKKKSYCTTPSSLAFQSGTTATLVCYRKRTLNDPTWFRFIEGEKKEVTINNSKYKLDPKSKTSLIISNINSEDQGYYFCKAKDSDSDGFGENLIYLNVYSCTTPSSLTFKLGTTATLVCCIRRSLNDCSPTWFRFIEGEEAPIVIDDSKYKLDPKSKNSLIISNIDSEDQGYYFCKASSSAGFGENLIYLNVYSYENLLQEMKKIQDLPRVLTPQSSYTFKLGRTATLECYIRGNKVDCSYTWFRIKEGEVIPVDMEDSKYNLNQKNKTSLVITEVMDEDQGYYLFEAKNSTGSGESILIYLNIDRQSWSSDAAYIEPTGSSERPAVVHLRGNQTK